MFTSALRTGVCLERFFPLINRVAFRISHYSCIWFPSFTIHVQRHRNTHTGSDPHPPQGSTPMYTKVASSMASGAAGALASTPADLVLIRMLADGRLEPSLQRKYRNIGDGIVRVVRLTDRYLWPLYSSSVRYL